MDNVVVVVMRPLPCHSPPFRTRSPSFQKGGGSDVPYAQVQRAGMAWAHASDTTVSNLVCWPLPVNVCDRLGEVMTNSLYLSKIDEYTNQVAFSEVPEEVNLEIANPNGESLQISASLPKQGMNLVADNTVLELKV